jgi:hypothetical protein
MVTVEGDSLVTGRDVIRTAVGVTPANGPGPALERPHPLSDNSTVEITIRAQTTDDVPLFTGFIAILLMLTGRCRTQRDGQTEEIVPAREEARGMVVAHDIAPPTNANDGPAG